MNVLARALLFAFTLMSGDKVPSRVVGDWIIGKPYDLGQGHPIGLDETQERAIIESRIRISPKLLTVCGRNVPITSVSTAIFSKSSFLSRYGFTPDRIGLTSPSITQVSINYLYTSKACGDIADPGSDLLIGGNQTVVELANDYFLLRRLNAN